MTSAGAKLRAVAVLVGTIVGAGIFGVPAALKEGGAVLGIFMFVTVGAAMTIIHLMMGEVALRTREKHRLVGYAARYLGPWGARAALTSDIVGIYGVLIAYFLLAGSFLHLLVGQALGGTAHQWTVVVFASVAVVSWLGLKKMSALEVPLGGIFLVALIAIVGWALPSARFENFEVPAANPLLLYGVVIFSLSGATIIPDLRDVLRGRERSLKPLIAWSTIFTALLIMAFSYTVLAVTGGGTTEDAITGLVPTLGRGVAVLGATFGLFAVLTSAFPFAVYLKEMFQYDARVPHLPAWLLAVVLPYVILLLTTPSFLVVLGLTGSLLGGIDGILIALMHRKATASGDRTPEYRLRIPKTITAMLVGLFILGWITEFVGVW